MQEPHTIPIHYGRDVFDWTLYKAKDNRPQAQPLCGLAL